MRSTFLFIAILAFGIVSGCQTGRVASGGSVDKLWQEADSLNKLNLPRSELGVVESIHQISMKENNSVDYIKSLVRRRRLLQASEEDATLKLITELENELALLWVPAKQMAHSILGDLYMQFYQSNRWKLLEKGNAVTGSENLHEMSAFELSAKAREHYLLSLADKELLASESSENYLALLINSDKKLHLRPTLYDLLVHRTIDKFLEGSFFEPEVDTGDQFNKEQLLGDREQFVSLSFPSGDSSMVSVAAVELLQEWLTLSGNRGNFELLVDVDLMRLQLMYGLYSGDDGMALYERALKRLRSETQGKEIEASVLYSYGSFLYYNNSDVEGSEGKRKYRLEAYALASEAVELWPESEGGILSKQLMEEISFPYLDLQCEGVALPKQNLSYLVNYNNVRRLYSAVYLLERPELDNLRKPDDEWIVKQLDNTKPLWTSATDLPDYGDFLNHSAELAVEMTPAPGLYALVVSDEPFEAKNPAKNKNYRYSLIQVSNLAFLQLDREDGVLIEVRSRDNGHALEGAFVDIYSSRRYGDMMTQQRFGPSNSKGEVFVENQAERLNYRLVVSKDEDSYFSGHQWWGRTKVVDEPVAVNRAFVFTDRKVYRPGQRVHFKAILMQQNVESSSALAGHSTYLTLRDANGRELARQSFISNDFGSFSGTFSLPPSGLTGQCSIETPYGSAFFSMEEYKRPRFELSIEPFKDLAVVGDSISLRASAITLTGVPLADARVEWKVSRSSGLWRHGFYRRPKIIASGSSSTNSEGKVDISFVASDDNNKMSFFSAYNYLIEVDISDQNGETRSASTSLTIDKTAYHLSSFISSTLVGSAISSVPVNISLMNHSGQGVKGSVSYHLEKLKSPSKAPVRPYWQKTDTVLWDKTQTENEEVVVEALISSGTWEIFGSEEKKIGVTNKLVTGYYRLRAEIIDISGDTVKSESGFTLINPSQANYTLGEALTLVNIGKPEAFYGEKLEFIVGSIYKDAQVKLYAVSGSQELINETVVPAGKWHRISLPVDKSLEGSIRIQAFLIKNNRIEASQEIVQLKDPSKSMTLELSKFRDKVKPGDKEKWTLTLKDANNKSANGEVLALMYDAALDLYQANDLSMNRSYYYNRQRPMWEWESFNYYYQGGNYNYYSGGASAAAYPSFFWEYQIYWGYAPPIMERSGRMKSLSIVEDNDAVFELAESVVVTGGVKSDVAPMIGQESGAKEAASEEATPLRTNLTETAFFLPHLVSAGDGTVEFEFSMPDALTRWRFMALAHRKDGLSANVEQMIISARDLMVVPNIPRVVREGDQLWLAVSVLNSSDIQLGGMASLEVNDATSGRTINSGGYEELLWEAEAGSSTVVRWKIDVPKGLKALEVLVKASSAQLSDAEKHIIAVLPSQTLVTETKPVMLTSAGSHQLIMPVLRNGEVENFEGFTFSYTENVAWEVLAALPWLVQQPHESADQIFNRFFSASVARQIFKQHPQIERVLNVWKAELPGDENALLSALEKNPELKSAFLTATPWLNKAQSDSERRRAFASLVADGHLDNEIYSAVKLLQQMQLSDGAWPWYSGMYPSEQTTINILAGFGFLQKMGVSWDNEAQEMVEASSRWLLTRLRKQKEDYEKAVINNKDVAGVSSDVIYKLYALSFDAAKMDASEVSFWIDILKKKLPRESPRIMAYAAIVLQRSANDEEAAALLSSLEEYLLEEGATRYFKLPYGPYWYQSPVETHVAAMEAFREFSGYDNVLIGMENWLIQQKLTQHWGTTRATVSAVYALASSSRELFTNDVADVITAGGKAIDFRLSETGSGYRSISVEGAEIDPKYGEITIQKAGDTPSFATVSLSYFRESADVEAGGFLDVSTTLMKREFVDNREIWTVVDADTRLTKGDRLMQRVVIETPQELDFVHVNAPRAATLEPVDILSGYRYQSGLAYYLSINDAGAGIFVDSLPKGRYTISWEMTVSHSGKAVQGPVQVSCFYAPSFAGHSSATVVVSE
jgi:uncharacterized protein YfaS (alpha-2-macroglobulin family)